MNTLSGTQRSDATSSGRIVSASYGFNFYVVGGTLPKDAPSYVERQADTDLYVNLTQGNFCYVLGQRQMGKSSLMVRTAVRLRQEGCAVAVLDLTSIGLNLTAEQWYSGLLGRIGQQLDLEDELEDYWLDHPRLSPLQRWMNALREVVIERYKDKVMVFIDEIDAVLSLPFSTDEFFTGIREFYNRRSEDAELSRLSFCLVGVATPADLVKDVRITPFNIGKRIDLTDFTESEAAQLARGLAHKGENEEELIRRVLYWTGGHPYLTQRLTFALADEIGAHGVRGVDRVCAKMFLSSRNREQDDNLQLVSNRILLSSVDTAGLLTLYAKVHQYSGVEDSESLISRLWPGFKHEQADETSPLVSILWLSGLVRISEGYLYVRNRIYYHVFDRQWVKENMPNAELRRQHAAYRKGLIRAAIIAAVIILLMLGLAIYALTQRNRAMNARTEAEFQRRSAAEAQRMAAYNGWQANVLIWQMIKDDTNPLTYMAYLDILDEDADKEFVEKARKRLQELKASPPRPNEMAQMRGVIRGKIYDTKSSEPIAGAQITARREDVDWELTMFSNKDGEFMLAPMPQGPYTITISSKGYTPQVIKAFQVGQDITKPYQIKHQSSGLTKKEANPS